MKDKIKIENSWVLGAPFDLASGMPKMKGGLRLRAPNEIVQSEIAAALAFEEGNQSAPDSPNMVNKINAVAWQSLTSNVNVESEKKVEMEVFQSPFMTKE